MPQARRLPTEQAARQKQRDNNGAPQPAAEETNGAIAVDVWARASQIALVGLFVIALVWAAYVAQPVLVPVMLAWVIATIVLPLVKIQERRGIPRGLAVLVVTAALVAMILLLIMLLGTPFSYWLSRASEFGFLLKQKLQTMHGPLAMLNEARQAINSLTENPPVAVAVEKAPGNMVTTIFSVLSPAVSEFILFVGALIFYLIYQKEIRAGVVQLLQDRAYRLMALRALSDIDESMTTYFGTFALVNTALGLIMIGLAWVTGLPNPLLWGVLAAVCNFVPYIGPAAVIATLAIVGLLTYPTVTEAIIPPFAYLIIVTIEGQFVTPTLLGKRLEMNPFAIFLAIAFCTWLWGPVGAFLAVPLLMALTVALGHAFVDEKPDLPE
ncbi:MAG TPA: AI-2E family transporter [Hyphomicrobiaceae bacterium]|nr:AI-2E family transporter [Hyphomicrobiaceae bacterium]